jgi:arylsulfatase
MFWEHEGNAAVRIGRWKLVRKHPGDWELYDMVADRTELDDLAATQPQRVREMAAQYEAWARRCGVLPREHVVALMRSQGVTRAFWEDE